MGQQQIHGSMDPYFFILNLFPPQGGISSDIPPKFRRLDFCAVLVVQSSNFADFHISPSRTWIRTPFPADFTKNVISENLDCQTFTKKREKNGEKKTSFIM